MEAPSSPSPPRPEHRRKTERPPDPPRLPRRELHGTIYQDDGKTYDFRNGQFFRQSFTCSLAANNTLTLHIAAPEGTFTPWWKDLRIEAYGWTPTSRQLITPTGTLQLKPSNNAWTATLPEPTQATDLTLK